jgi:hypothetical protein
MCACRTQDLLRNTPETHPDHNNLADALKSTKEIADYINESIRQAEQSAKFRNLATQGEQFRVRGSRNARHPRKRC